MAHFREKDRYDYGDLLEIIRILRSPEGCPWDQVQTHASIRRGLLEEAYEAAEAIDRDDAPLLQEELEEHDLTSGAKDIMPYGEAEQLSFFRESDEPTMEHPFMAELREKDLSDMTPLEALNYLYVLQEKLKNEE